MGLGSLEFVLPLLLHFVGERHLPGMVESIMDSFLSTLTAWLRVHQLGVRWILLLFNFAPDLHVSQMLAQEEGLLVCEKLIFCAALVTRLF